jgi:hypothetical protein
MGRGGRGWHAATPSLWGGRGHSHWLGVAQPPLPILFFFFKKNNKFIYFIYFIFLINLYFFIQMDTCRHLIGLTWC